MQIIGFCRFSFFGRSDTQLDYSDLQAAAQALYDPARIEHRLYLTKTLLIPSMLAQTDPDFRLIMISSDRMPEPYKTQLLQICKPCPQIEVVFSDKMDIKRVIMPYLREVSDKGTKDFVQFRIDDDDCLTSNYIAKLREHGQAGLQQRVITFPHGLILYKNPEGDAQIIPAYRPYTGAGWAYHGGDQGVKNVFGFAHGNTRYTRLATVDPLFFSFIQCMHWNSDSRHRQERALKRYLLFDKPKQQEDWLREKLPEVIDRDYPFLSRDQMMAVAQNL